MSDFEQQLQKIKEHYDYLFNKNKIRFCPRCGFSNVDIQLSIRYIDTLDSSNLSLFDGHYVGECNKCGLTFDILVDELSNLAMWDFI